MSDLHRIIQVDAVVQQKALQWWRKQKKEREPLTSALLSFFFGGAIVATVFPDCSASCIAVNVPVKWTESNTKVRS